MDADNYFILTLIVLFVLVLLGFKYCYVMGFGNGIMNVCGNLTAYSRDSGKHFFCSEKISSGFSPDFSYKDINFSNSGDFS